MEHNLKGELKMNNKIKKIGKLKNNNLKIMWVSIAIVILVIIGIIIFNKFNSEKVNDEIKESELPYSDTLLKRIEGAEKSNLSSIRPDYLPKEMFANLPQMPEDFYQVRQLIRLGRLNDFETLEEGYWMQPEFFPYFEEIGLPLLQNPPKDRWGAYGIAVYPADWVQMASGGDELTFYFYIKSGYLVETYQGVNLVKVFPENAQITTGQELPGGIKLVNQIPDEVSKYFDVEVNPNPFVLEPNFPIYKSNGTIKIKVSLKISEDIPDGNYVVAIDTANVPEDYEQKWIKKYLNLYTSGSMTKLDRPYYQIFLQINNQNGGEI
jgi:hypothetical protein